MPQVLRIGVLWRPHRPEWPKETARVEWELGPSLSASSSPVLAMEGKPSTESIEAGLALAKELCRL